MSRERHEGPFFESGQIADISPLVESPGTSAHPIQYFEVTEVQGRNGIFFREVATGLNSDSENQLPRKWQENLFDLPPNWLFWN